MRYFYQNIKKFPDRGGFAPFAPHPFWTVELCSRYFASKSRISGKNISKFFTNSEVHLSSETYSRLWTPTFKMFSQFWYLTPFSLLKLLKAFVCTFCMVTDALLGFLQWCYSEVSGRPKLDILLLYFEENNSFLGTSCCYLGGIFL